MRVAVLTLEGSRYGLRLLNALERTGNRPELVIVIDDSVRRRLRLLRRVAARNGWRDALLTAHKRNQADRRARASAEWRGAPLTTDYRALGEIVVTASTLDDPRVRDALALTRTDLMLLGQPGIVPAPLLAIPKLGTLNAHPGWLPEYRGVDCAQWAIERGDFGRVGSTLHLVDAGVDTGAVITRRRYEWRGGETLASVEADLYEDCIDLLLAGRELAVRGKLTGEPQDTKAPYCHKLPRARLAAAAAELETFLASRTNGVGQRAAA